VPSQAALDLARGLSFGGPACGVGACLCGRGGRGRLCGGRVEPAITAPVEAVTVWARGRSGRGRVYAPHRLASPRVRAPSLRRIEATWWSTVLTDVEAIRASPGHRLAPLRGIAAPGEAAWLSGFRQANGPWGEESGLEAAKENLAICRVFLFWGRDRVRHRASRPRERALRDCPTWRNAVGHKRLVEPNPGAVSSNVRLLRKACD
jgi:hypothetical protein